MENSTLKYKYVIEEMKRDISPELMDDIKGLDTTLLADGSSKFIAMDQGIKPLTDEMFIAGPAFTVRPEKGDSNAVSQALKMVQPGDVLVIDAHGTDYNAVWGDVKSLMAKARGLAGVVIDGAIRDKRDCIKVGLPVFYKYLVCSASNKVGLGEINVPINCGNQVVQPGDIIVGDCNGVLVISPEELPQVIEGAKKKLEKTEMMIEKILKGHQNVDYK